MKILKRTVLIIGFLAWSAFLVDRSYMLGAQTRYNEIMWFAVSEQYQFPTSHDPIEQRRLYEADRHTFAFKTDPEWAFRDHPEKYARLAETSRKPANTDEKP